MTVSEICLHLESKGYNVAVDKSGQEFVVTIEIGEQEVRLIHRFQPKIERLPKFELDKAPTYGTLAHVVIDPSTDRGSICVQENDSISVNFEMPELAVEESLVRHIKLITDLVIDPEFNREELLREFRDNWRFLTEKANTTSTALYTATSGSVPALLQVRSPVKTAKLGIRNHYLALDEQQATRAGFEEFRAVLGWAQRSASGKAIVLRLESLEPAPCHPNEIGNWYLDALNSLDSDSSEAFERFTRHPSKEFWIKFVAPTPTGLTEFGINFLSNRKLKLPTDTNGLIGWKLRPVNIRPLEKNVLLPRGGAQTHLQDKSVLLVGCGSVGSEIAYRMASTGLGTIVLSDPDFFGEENLYRHTLGIKDIEFPKSFGIAQELQQQYPWVSVEYHPKFLDEIDDSIGLEPFDLVIIAIGSPTHERLFHDYITRRGLKVAVINTWVEAGGIGGHAMLDIPGKKGCFRCAYVDPVTLRRGLASNLNFLEPNQDLSVTHGGCGTQYLPYDGIAAGKTALLASEMALKFLNGAVSISSKISWAGDPKDALSRGYKLSYRYSHFENSNEILPLLNDECDVCV